MCAGAGWALATFHNGAAALAFEPLREARRRQRGADVWRRMGVL